MLTYLIKDLIFYQRISSAWRLICLFACSLSSSFCCCSCWFMIFLQLARRSEISSFVLSFSVRFGVVSKCS